MTNHSLKYNLFNQLALKSKALGHIPEAINIPIEQLAQKLPELHTDKTLVVYCCGPCCMWSQQALDQLQKQGIKAKRLAEGYPEWQQFKQQLVTVNVS
ncbi:rhodanese-like domain-containing protein [Thiomicrospira sp. R3]|uniref:rhodanese-like domain-containing protein n=1 Tax=Thiomicrospira sp. R3 TaxID=3035472 RepID=UPI00259B26B7|nr:rhodanese-like domain-containing protein [Thiomicrospira sp. R3]WFE69555.1 rhodanese-like domain-containing protein [Thiomicrospira sp. R3]